MNEELRLGDFEARILRAVFDLGEDNAYGIPIMDSIREQTGKEPAIGAIYTVLSRLEQKGFVSSKMSEPTAERGGRRKKLYRIEGQGYRALQAKADTLRRGLNIVEPIKA